MEALLGLAVLAIGAVLANLIVRQTIQRVFRRAAATWHARGSQALTQMVRRLANVVPAIIVARGVGSVPHLAEPVIMVVRNVSGAFMVLTIALAVGAGLNLVNEAYQRRPDAGSRPIKGYVQVVKILVYAGAAILIAAALMEQSPLLLLSGLGAMAAVLMLVFKDTILSLVASVQLTSNDMLRVGDWIEMPQLNADGDVIDIALHTVKVQNWDKTITTIPTKKLISDSFKNWRGMSEAGGRRIKRSMHIDQKSVRFLGEEEVRLMRRFRLIEAYWSEKLRELDAWNGRFDQQVDAVNTRRVTNLGTYRAYVERYLRAHPAVHQEMTLIVRQLQPGETGIPLEVYCFTNDTRWAAYEGIQSDIFDHLLAILPEFGLSVFQASSDAPLRISLTDARTLHEVPGAAC